MNRYEPRLRRRASSEALEVARLMIRDEIGSERSDWRARIAPAPQNRARILAGAESAPTAPRCLGADLVQGKINSAVQVGGGQRVRNAPVGVQAFARGNRLPQC